MKAKLLAIKNKGNITEEEAAEMNRAIAYGMTKALTDSMKNYEKMKERYSKDKEG